MSKRNNIMDKLGTYEGIIVDTREPMEKFESNWVFFYKNAKDNKNLPVFKYQALPYGDYLICTKNHRLLIERKEVHDYCRSLGERLDDRFNHMRIENERTMLLIEGDPDWTDQDFVYRWNYQRQVYIRAIDVKTFKNFPLSQQLNGSMFVQTRDYKDTVLTIINYYYYLNELLASEKKIIDKPWERWFSLAPFVGKRSAKKLIQKYDNCYDALVNIEEWANKEVIDGIKGKLEKY